MLSIIFLILMVSISDALYLWQYTPINASALSDWTMSPSNAMDFINNSTQCPTFYGSKCFRIHAYQGSVSRSISTIGYYKIQLSGLMRITSIVNETSGGECAIDYSVDNNVFYPVMTVHSDDTYTNNIIILEAEWPDVTANNQNTFIIRLRNTGTVFFRCTFSRIQLTANPTPSPTENPTTTTNPTVNPTINPTTTAPTTNPTLNPTTLSPSVVPTSNPITANATTNPTMIPTVNPSLVPTINPTKFPSQNPTLLPTNNPTSNPTENPMLNLAPSSTVNPTSVPTMNPTANPSKNPTTDPTIEPTLNPTSDPIIDPTVVPTSSHSTTTSNNPTLMSANNPSFVPTNNPTSTLLYKEIKESTLLSTDETPGSDNLSDGSETWLMYGMGAMGFVTIFICILLIIFYTRWRKAIQNSNTVEMQTTEIIKIQVNQSHHEEEEKADEVKVVKTNDSAKRLPKMTTLSIEAEELYATPPTPSINKKGTRGGYLSKVTENITSLTPPDGPFTETGYVQMQK